MNAAENITPGPVQGAGYGPDRTWKARIDLRFTARPEKTILQDVTFKGPLRIQRPFYPEKEPCHCYLLHPPGGLVSGDRLRIQAEIDPGAHALLTTPSAGKVYGTDSHNVAQGQDVELTVRDGVCEWLPMETIIFDRANAALNTSIELSGSAECIGWDILCLGRPQGGTLSSPAGWCIRWTSFGKGFHWFMNGWILQETATCSPRPLAWADARSAGPCLRSGRSSRRRGWSMRCGKRSGRRKKG